MPRDFRVHKLQTARSALQRESAAPEPPDDAKKAGAASKKPKEIGGPSGPEPTRYGDWERKGICVDF